MTERKSIMRNSRVLVFALLLTGIVISVSACGGGGGGAAEGIAENETAVPTSTLSISASGSNALTGDVAKMDAQGLFKAADTMADSCAFSIPATTTKGIPIVALLTTCTDPRKCIVCTNAAASTDCSFTCTGIVPSTSAMTGDTLVIPFAVTSQASSVMLGPGQMLFQASTSGAVAASLDLTILPDFNVDGCEGTAPTDMTLGTPAVETVCAAGACNYGASVTPPGAGTNNCVVIDTFTISYDLNSLATPGTSLDLTGTVAQLTKICDDPLQANCTN